MSPPLRGSSGGVIHISTDPYNITTATLNQSSFINNQADEDGGVICVTIGNDTLRNMEKSRIKINNESKFTFNTAVRSEGIIAIFGGQLVINSRQICCSNTANLGGIIKACKSDIMISMQDELFHRVDPVDMQCTLYENLFLFNTTHSNSACYSSSLHPKNTILIGISIMLFILVLVLLTILICVILYLYGIFKHKVGIRSKVNDHCFMFQ